MKNIKLFGKYEDVEPIARCARRKVCVLGEFTQYSEPGAPRHDQEVVKVLFIGNSRVNFQEPEYFRLKDRGG